MYYIMDAETLTHVSLSIASIIYIVTAFINTIYQIQMARETELHKMTDEAVNYVWYNYVKDIRGTNAWTDYAKQEAENRAITYVKDKINCYGCIASEQRLRSWIRSSVENKKSNRIYVKRKYNEMDVYQ